MEGDVQPNQRLAMADIVSDLGVNLLEEEIDEVIFQTNQFLTDATFTGSQGPFWWFLLIVFWDYLEPDINQLLTRICPNCPKTDGTKTGQKSDLSIQRAVCLDALFRLPSHPSDTKVILCPVTSKRFVDITLIFNPRAFNHPGSKHSGRQSRLFITGTHLVLIIEKVDIFSKNFRSAFDVQCCHSLQGGIVHSGIRQIAVCFAIIHSGGLYIRGFRIILNHTGLLQLTSTPCAISTTSPLYIPFAIPSLADVPIQPCTMCRKCGHFRASNTLFNKIIRLFI